MIYIYSKEKKPKLTFDINLTLEEALSFTENNLFIDHPELNPEDYVVIESDQVFKYPIWDEVEVRECIRNEAIILYNATELLVDGEKIVDGELVQIPKPKELIRPQWNGLEWVEAYTQDEMNEEIDRIKEDILSTGFLWRNQHEQKCRDKDVAKLNNAISSINYIYIKDEDKKVLWRFNDEDKVVLTLEDLMDLQASMFGFMQNVNDAEDKIKSGDLKQYDKTDFLREIKRIGGIH